MPVSDQHDPAVLTGDETVLRTAGLRVTRPRLAVLESLRGRPHAGADRVRDDVTARLGAVSHQAVYDVLNVLTACGLVRRIQPAGSPARFELRVGDNHHHLVCRSCGTVEDVDCATGAAPCLAPSDLATTAPGFVLDEAEVTWWGLCHDCAAAAPAAQPASSHHRHDQQQPHDPTDPHPRPEGATHV